MTIGEPLHSGEAAQEYEADWCLEELLLEGLDTGEDIPVTREFWQDLKVDAARRLGARGANAPRAE